MRYIPLYSKTRLVTAPGNIGQHWNRKYLRAVQCVLVRTRGIVGTKLSFFDAAFGNNAQEYERILLMPEDYIINRDRHARDGSTERWERDVHDLSLTEKDEFFGIVANNDFRRLDMCPMTTGVRRALEHYLVRDGDPTHQLALELA